MSLIAIFLFYSHQSITSWAQKQFPKKLRNIKIKVIDFLHSEDFHLS